MSKIMPCKYLVKQIFPYTFYLFIFFFTFRNKNILKEIKHLTAIYIFVVIVLSFKQLRYIISYCNLDLVLVKSLNIKYVDFSITF